MPTGLKRYQQEGHLHLITFSCFERRPYLGSAEAHDLFVLALERMRGRHGFAVVGYVVMPEHVHLLMSEPPSTMLSRALHGLKLSVAKRRPETPFWTVRYHDFKRVHAGQGGGKVKYLHRNPVKRELCARSKDWRWSSYGDYHSSDGLGRWSSRMSRNLRIGRSRKGGCGDFGLPEMSVVVRTHLIALEEVGHALLQDYPSGLASSV